MSKPIVPGPYYICYPKPETKTVLICFTGAAGQVGMPDFEFEKTASPLPASRIMLKDPEIKFYLTGVPGLGKNVDETVEKLRAMIADLQAERVVCLGNSMGGYGAILYGALLEADVTLAFKSRTTLNWRFLLQIEDHRKYTKLQSMYLSRPKSRPYFDLRKVLERPDSKHGETRLYYSAGDPIYEPYARHLEGVRGVTLYEIEHPKKTGQLINYMKNSGQLASLLEEALNPI